MLETNCTIYDANQKLSNTIIIKPNVESEEITALSGFIAQKPTHRSLGFLKSAPNSVAIVIMYKTAPIITFTYVILVKA